MSSILEEQLQRAIYQKVEIVEYDPIWSHMFDIELQRLKELCGKRLSNIEHVGSTAVPNLAAKPIIDIIAIVTSLLEADALVELLCANGYTTSAEFNATLVDSRWLMRQSEGKRTHHLHLILPNNDDWLKKVQFRDLLRKDSDLRQAYLKLKQKLAEELGHDREAYTYAKTEFIYNALKQ